MIRWMKAHFFEDQEQIDGVDLGGAPWDHDDDPRRLTRV